VSCFEDSLEIDCKNVNAMVNLAVAKTKVSTKRHGFFVLFVTQSTFKLARIARDPIEKDRLFEASFRS
jgi:hypothetical protein